MERCGNLKRGKFVLRKDTTDYWMWLKWWQNSIIVCFEWT